MPMNILKHKQHLQYSKKKFHILKAETFMHNYHFPSSDFKVPLAEIIAEEQAGFRAGRSTTEQIFNQRILCEKDLQHQQDL